MAWANSYIPSATIRDALKNSIALNIGSDTLNIALFNNSVSPLIYTDPQEYGVSPWNANEVDGTGWSAGGVALVSPAIAITSTNTIGIYFSASNVSENSTTLASAYGALIYDATLSNQAVAAIDFGAAYSTTAGTFAITWDATGIWYIQLH